MATATVCSAKPDPRLDLATLTVPRWTVSLWDKGGEASITYVPEPSDGLSAPSEPDPERSEREAARRAAGVVRRYCTHHGLNRLLTLTFDPQHLPEGVDGLWEAVEGFRRRLAAYCGGEAPAMVVVPEWGEQSGRIHVHGVIGRYIPKGDLQKLWGQGFVDVRKLKARGARGARADARVCAAYVASYVGKSFGDADGHRDQHRRRYSTTKGTAVEPRRALFATLDEAWEWTLRENWGTPIVGTWASSSVEDWAGPPVYLFYWGDPP